MIIKSLLWSFEGRQRQHPQRRDKRKLPISLVTSTPKTSSFLRCPYARITNLPRAFRLCRWNPLNHCRTCSLALTKTRARCCSSANYQWAFSVVLIVKGPHPLLAEDLDAYLEYGSSRWIRRAIELRNLRPHTLSMTAATRKINPGRASNLQFSYFSLFSDNSWNRREAFLRKSFGVNINRYERRQSHSRRHRGNGDRSVALSDPSQGRQKWIWRQRFGPVDASWVISWACLGPGQSIVFIAFSLLILA